LYIAIDVTGIFGIVHRIKKSRRFWENRLSSSSGG